MIPGKIIHFLEEAIVAMGGSRDNDLQPHVHRISGWMLAPDQETVTCLVAEGFTHELSSVEENGEFALTVCDVPSHEAYQFKGRFIALRPITEGDLGVFQRFRDRFVARIHQLFGFPEEILRLYIPQPVIALSFKVREIYLQTPGPGAGTRLVPRENN
jgi:hypothetical protein